MEDEPYEMFNAPEYEAIAVGVNTRFTWHAALGARLLPQLLVWLKTSDAVEFIKAILLIASALLPRFRTVTALELLDPTVVEGKKTDGELTDKAELPVPLRKMAAGENGPS